MSARRFLSPTNCEFTKDTSMIETVPEVLTEIRVSLCIGPYKLERLFRRLLRTFVAVLSGLGTELPVITAPDFYTDMKLWVLMYIHA